MSDAATVLESLDRVEQASRIRRALQEVGSLLQRLVVRQRDDDDRIVTGPGDDNFFAVIDDCVERLGEVRSRLRVADGLQGTWNGPTSVALLDGRDLDPAVPRDGTVLGCLFESLIALDVRMFAQGAAEARVHHLRTKNGRHEVDFVITGTSNRTVGIEVKLSATVDDADVRHPPWLRDQLGADLVDMIIVTTGTDAYRRTDGVAVVPAALLGP